jgi:hypothetical protein
MEDLMREIVGQCSIIEIEVRDCPLSDILNQGFNTSPAKTVLMNARLLSGIYLVSDQVSLNSK